MARKADDWVGIERHGAGYRARVSRGRGVSPSLKQFQAGTPLHEMQAWREDERARLRLTRKQRASFGTFEGDARRYLRAVSSLATFSDRERQIALWVKEFGTRQRDSITGADIRAVLNRWLVEPRKPGVDPETEEKYPPVSPATVNLRKRALSNLYTVLDADADPPRRNPVRAIDDFEESPTRARDLPYAVIGKILARMPDYGRLKKGEKRKDKVDDFSKSRIIAAILAYTGLEPVQLERLKKADVDLEFGFIVLAPRRKGKRRQARARAMVILPLVPPAVEAFKTFDARGLWEKKIDRSALRKAFKAAARQENVAHVRIKDLRHSFSTLVVETTEDLDLAKDLLMHKDQATTKIYSARVLAQRLKAKLAPVVRRFGSTDDGKPEENRGNREVTR